MIPYHSLVCTVQPSLQHYRERFHLYFNKIEMNSRFYPSLQKCSKTVASSLQGMLIECTRQLKIEIKKFKQVHYKSTQIYVISSCQAKKTGLNFLFHFSSEIMQRTVLLELYTSVYRYMHLYIQCNLQVTHRQLLQCKYFLLTFENTSNIRFMSKSLLVHLVLAHGQT